MADTIELDPGTGGAVVSTEEVTTLNGGSVAAQHVTRMLLAYRTSDGVAVDLTGDTTNGLDVDVTRSALPTGASTSAKQDTMIGHLDGVEGLLTTIDADTSALAGAVAGTEVQVDVLTLPALPAGKNNIGDVDVASLPALPAGNNNIGDVDVASSVLPTGAATSAKQPALGTAGASSTDVISVQGIASGTALPVSVATIPSHAVTNAGTFAVQDSQKVADDAAFTVGTTPVNPVGYLADETATDSVDEGDAGAARMTLDRKLIVTVQPHTAGGWDVKNCTSGDGSTALTNGAQAIKASAGKLGGWFIYNPNASAAYVPIYNVASGSVTVGTTNPLMVLTIPATSAANLEMVNGLTFDTAISAAAATTAAGNSALGTALEANFFFK
jgi:hypothetical protein